MLLCPQGPTSVDGCIGMQFFATYFNKGSISPSAHHPAEVVGEKSYYDVGEVDLFSNSSLGASLIFFGSSSVP